MRQESKIKTKVTAFPPTVTSKAQNRLAPHQYLILKLLTVFYLLFYESKVCADYAQNHT